MRHYILPFSSTESTVPNRGLVLFHVIPNVASAPIILKMEALPTALGLHWSASTLRVKCPFCLSSHGHRVGELPRNLQKRGADCYHISGGQSYRILYRDEESDFTVPFGLELNKEENTIYTVTHQGRLCDPLR